MFTLSTLIREVNKIHNDYQVGRLNNDLITNYIDTINFINFSLLSGNTNFLDVSPSKLMSMAINSRHFVILDDIVKHINTDNRELIITLICSNNVLTSLLGLIPYQRDYIIETFKMEDYAIYIMYIMYLYSKLVENNVYIHQNLINRIVKSCIDYINSLELSDIIYVQYSIVKILSIEKTKNVIPIIVALSQDVGIRMIVLNIFHKYEGTVYENKEDIFVNCYNKQILRDVDTIMN